MQHFSNYFVQILVIRPKCQRGQRWSKGRESKKFQEKQLPRPRLTRCKLGFAVTVTGFFFLPYPCKIKRKENSSCSACGHLQDLIHLPLDCPASEPLGAPYLTPLLPFSTSGPDLGVWSDCYVSVEFFHHLIPRNGSASTTITTNILINPRIIVKCTQRFNFSREVNHLNH